MSSSPQHHPSDALLASLASGSIEAGQALVTIAHVRMCPTCRRRYAMLEAVGGALLDELPPAPLSRDAIRAVFDRLDDAANGADEAALADRRAAPETRRPPPLVRVGRFRNLAPGVDWAEALHTGGAARLFRIAPGARVPAHGHDGGEVMLVLKGGLVDRCARCGPGDLLELGDEIHAPEASLGGVCLCLATARRLIFVEARPPVDFRTAARA